MDAEEHHGASERRYYRARASLIARGRLSEVRLDWTDGAGTYEWDEAPYLALVQCGKRAEHHANVTPLEARRSGGVISAGEAVRLLPGTGK